MIVDGLVSTVIPVHNRPRMVREAVESVLAQTWESIEIIVVDDGSTDGTPHVLEVMAEAYPDRVRVIRQKNAGPGRAREAGRLQARGEFIQYLDSDDLLLPDKFNVQVSALRQRPECSIAYGITELVDEKGNVLTSPYKWTGRQFDELFPALLVDRWWNTHTPLWRRSLCDEIGPWIDRRMAEDWDYDARAGALNAKLVHCPERLNQTRRHVASRLTDGEMDDEKVRAIGSLLSVLYQCACAAMVDHDGAEMKHFSRWAFSVSRQSALAGDRNAARRLFAIAVKANQGSSADMKFFRTAAAVVGWGAAARIATSGSRMMGRVAGRNTRRQSWMQVSP